MESGPSSDSGGPGGPWGPEEENEEDEENGLEWLLNQDSSESISVPMDTNIPLKSPKDGSSEMVGGDVFTRERVFQAASQGDAELLHSLMDFLLLHNKRLTSPEFTDETNGKTALLKALLNLKNGKNDTIEVLMDIAEKTGDLQSLINASYTDPFYKGQTALHVAIERRSFDHVQLLVQKGADVQAKANGKFFQRHKGLGFYFGELPLSLAACTNQPEIVAFLMDNPHRRADVTDKDSQGNTVLHTLVIIADNTQENTDMIANVYDEILIRHHKLQKKKQVDLERIENNRGLIPLKLAAKLGKIGIFKHILDREFTDEETKPLSRKYTEWVYGPVRSSLYEMRSIDTDEAQSVLEIIVFGSEIPNRPELLQIEPLRSLLEDKWEMFASKLFWTKFVFYLIYLLIFTAVACFRKDGQPPFPIEKVPLDYFRSLGEIISVLGAVWFLYNSIRVFLRNPPTLKSLFIDGFSDILFFLQAVLLLVAAVLYACARREYVGLLVLSLALSWMNVLYYSRGSKQMGIYNVMMQRMILGDLMHFLCVYSVMLLGFSAAIVALIDDSPPGMTNDTSIMEAVSSACQKPSYNDVSFTTLEMFKFTIGMGNLEFTDQVEYKQVFFILLICYIIFTYILLLNMLIALMGNTVNKTSEQSENIWNLQRSFTILDMERSLPRCITTKLVSKTSKRVCFTTEQDQCRRFFRVEEMNWRQWRSDVGRIRDEDPEDHATTSPYYNNTPERRWRLNLLMERIRHRRTPREAGVP
ncbi:transient receptor potential cation channel subfamily V member 1-like [Gouania willdenowi]|uniref:Transient receptor potential cation channel subfamily V member 1-like n=1 Tax=Gouania willdenowi TaxID=441366 RepID=A0A8C5HKV7_GOUWI|nr:transient receptor potential cation channel subfamily V member 1-like [Gouania willdenowi]